MVTEMSNDSTSPSLTDSRMLSADLCERGYKRVYLPSSAPLVFVSNKFADNIQIHVCKSVMNGW